VKRKRPSAAMIRRPARKITSCGWRTTLKM
jgi:hypothetical protein